MTSTMSMHPSCPDPQAERVDSSDIEPRLDIEWQNAAVSGLEVRRSTGEHDNGGQGHAMRKTIGHRASLARRHLLKHRPSLKSRTRFLLAEAESAVAASAAAVASTSTLTGVEIRGHALDEKMERLRLAATGAVPAVIRRVPLPKDPAGGDEEESEDEGPWCAAALPPASEPLTAPDAVLCTR